MLQQTTVKAVIPYYSRWIKAFPSVEHVARASEQKILKMWQGLGYYQRARNLHKAAKILCQEFGGRLPRSPEQLKLLPGFGPYTVGAVASIAFEVRHPIVDANVRRVIMRLLALHGMAEQGQDKKILDFLAKILPIKKVGDFNQALMELGALVCRSREPLCHQCPLTHFCNAYQKDIQEIIPAPKQSRLKKIKAVVAVIKRNNKFLIQKRSDQGLLAGMWEFPGGKIEKGETPNDALKREIKEELGVRISSSRFLLNVRHYYTQFKVHLSVWLCTLENHPSENRHCRWVTQTDFKKYPMPSGSAKIVDFLNEMRV